MALRVITVLKEVQVQPVKLENLGHLATPVWMEKLAGLEIQVQLVLLGQKEAPGSLDLMGCLEDQGIR